MEAFISIIRAFYGLKPWRYKYYFLRSVLRMFYWVLCFNFLSAIQRPPTGYEKKTYGHVLGYWLMKNPLKPYNVMIIVADGASPVELAPETIYRDTPKKHEDAITLIIESDRLTCFLHVGKNRADFIPLETQHRVIASMKPYIERNEILGGIRVGLRILNRGKVRL